MLKITLAILVVLISIYWVGEKARKNVKIDEFLSSIEGRYSSLNERIEDATILSGLHFLRRLYGWASIFLFACLFIVQRFFQSSVASFLPLFWFFSFTFMAWFSIKWVIGHKNTIGEFSKTYALFIFGPLLMGIFDLIFHTPFTKILFPPIQQFVTMSHLSIPDISNPLAIGGTVSLVVIFFLCFYYIITWIVAVPVFLISVFAVILPIKFARLLAKIDRGNTFFWFTAFIMLVISIWLTQL
ncbi:conserved membrane hypothetical protein [Burkholderia diffusa]|uniref:hypothetical protein n=1 Tax=Burkholderia diffusa TaxID=488732 RepID=UPI001CAEEB55|nr:hypothetical protein [Burkholderia diffusa]CAG9264009.1 conserved membrane hypothetical protein [Burkholderia diffusa]